MQTIKFNWTLINAAQSGDALKSLNTIVKSFNGHMVCLKSEGLAVRDDCLLYKRCIFLHLWAHRTQKSNANLHENVDTAHKNHKSVLFSLQLVFSDHTFIAPVT